MARDSEREPSRSNREPSRNEREQNGIEIQCPTCDCRWEVGRANDRTCPQCGVSFSVRIHDRFALVEREGWAVAVSVAAVEDRPMAEIAGDG